MPIKDCCALRPDPTDFRQAEIQGSEDQIWWRAPLDVLGEIASFVATGASPIELATNVVNWSKVCVLTHKLAHKTGIVEKIPEALQDDALLKTWASISKKLDFHGTARPQTLSEIKAWFNDPANTAQLNNIKQLDLSDLDLKAIPHEITKFAQLEMLVLHHNQIRDISALGNLSQLKTLYLGHNLISDISALANLVQLKQLHLGRNQIRDISALKNLDQLQTLDLGNNQISDISALSGLQQLGWLSLTQNPITHISALFGLDRLEILYLINAPLLFVHEKDFDKITLKHNSLKLLSNKFHEISEHKCESNLSRFIQFIAMGNCGLEQIQEKFAELDPRDKNLIYGMVYQTAGSKSQDPQWGELHAFDDRSVFNRAVRKAISAKFDRLSQEEKNRVYGNICELAGHPATSDLQWGEEHAFENVLRLVDAMNRVPAPGV